MTVTKVGIVYSTGQQVIRRIIHYTIDDSEGDIHKQTLLNGESWVEIPEADYDQIATHQGIHDYLGLKGISGQHDRCAVVDGTGKITAIILADPAIDSIPNHSLHIHDKAEVGGTLLNGVYNVPVVAI